MSTVLGRALALVRRKGVLSIFLCIFVGCKSDGHEGIGHAADIRSLS
jgi:hypothetical protein